MIWTKEKTQFLIDSYPRFGANYCSKIVGLTPKQITHKVQKLGLIITPEGRSYVAKNTIHLPKPNNRLNVNPEQFLQPCSKEVVYILGLLWGDGYITPKKYGIWHTTTIDDCEDFIPIFQKTGKWNISKRKRKHWKESVQIRTHTKILYNFLELNDYRSKFKSPEKILSLIPKSLIHYWFRGLSDADGCFYLNKKGYLRQFSIAGPYEQDWSYMEDLSNNLGIEKLQIALRKYKKNKSSIVRLTNKSDIMKMGEFIYKDYDGIGLRRKYKKYTEIIS